MAKKSLSRTENILENKIDSTTPIEESPQSRVEKLLVQMNTGSGSGEVVDLSGIQQDIVSLQNKVSMNETTLYDSLTSLTNKIKDNEVQVTGQIGYLTSIVNANKTSTDEIIESIENNIEALDEEVHEPEILNAPIEIEGAFPQVLPGYFNDAQMNEMYVWTYFVPDPTGSKLPNKQAGMEHLDDLIKKCFMYHEEFKKLQTSIENLTKAYNTLYQACKAQGIIQ